MLSFWSESCAGLLAVSRVITSFVPMLGQEQLAKESL